MIERRRRRRRSRASALLVGAGVVLGLSVGPAAPGSGEPTVESGWWMNPIAVAPDAPADGLVVQGGPAGEAAYGAVRFVLTPGDVPQSLLLRIAPDTATTPNTSLALCPLTEPFTPAQGGAMADAPAYDCETSVEAGSSADGTTYTFDVAELVTDQGLELAILPTAATDRVVLDAPAVYSLTLATDTPPLPDLDTSSGGGGTSPGGSLDGPLAPPSVGAAPTFPAAPAVPALPAVPGPAPKGATSPPAPPTLATAPVAQQGEGDGGSMLAALLLAGLAAAAAGLWGAAGADTSEPLDELAPALRGRPM